MIELLEKVVPTDFVVKIATWIIGEIGSSYYADDPDKLAELVKIVMGTFEYDFEDQSSKKWPLDAVVKLASMPQFKHHSDVKLLLEKYSKHGDIELYQRALGTFEGIQNRRGWPSITQLSETLSKWHPNSEKAFLSLTISCSRPG